MNFNKFKEAISGVVDTAKVAAERKKEDIQKSLALAGAKNTQVVISDDTCTYTFDTIEEAVTWLKSEHNLDVKMQERSKGA